MKYLIRYYYIKSFNLFAVPEYDHEEIVEAKSAKELDKYIISQKDQYGNNYKVKSYYEFTHISNRGAVKVTHYSPPKVKKI